MRVRGEISVKCLLAVQPEGLQAPYQRPYIEKPGVVVCASSPRVAEAEAG